MDGRWKVEGEHSGTMEGEEVTTLSKGMFGVGSVRTVWGGDRGRRGGRKESEKGRGRRRGKREIEKRIERKKAQG